MRKRRSGGGIFRAIAFTKPWAMEYNSVSDGAEAGGVPTDGCGAQGWSRFSENVPIRAVCSVSFGGDKRWSGPICCRCDWGYGWMTCTAARARTRLGGENMSRKPAVVLQNAINHVGLRRMRPPQSAHVHASVWLSVFFFRPKGFKHQ